MKATVKKVFLLKNLPLILILIIIPLCVYPSIHNTPLNEFPWYPSSANFDFYLFFKQKLLIFTGIFIIIFTIFHAKIQPLSKFYSMKSTMRMFGLLISYGILSFVSTIFSKYSYYSFHGVAEQYESIWVILTYVLVLLYCAFWGLERYNQYLFCIFISIGVFLLCFIGLSQFLNHNVLQLIFPDVAFWNGYVFSTLYNPNYVGTYVNLVLPVFTCLLLGPLKSKYKIPLVITGILLLINLIGSKSAAGFFIMLITLLFSISFVRMWIKRHWKFSLGITILLLSIVIINKDYIKEHYWNKLLLSKPSSINVSKLTSIKTEDSFVSITYGGEVLNIYFSVNDFTQTGEFFLFDRNDLGIETELSDDGTHICIRDSRFEDIILYPVMLDIDSHEDIIFFSAIIDGKEWMFTNQTDNTYYYLTNNGKLDKIEAHEKKLLNNYSSLASGRGYIWSKTIPLLKDYILLGNGPDTFVLTYPNSDYVDDYNNGYGQTLVSKPHNFYLQIWIQTGLLSLICFIGAYLIYFFTSLKIYWGRSFTSSVEWLGFGIFLGTLSYMLIGFINDSSITVAPIFWCMIGIGVAINNSFQENFNHY